MGNTTKPASEGPSSADTEVLETEEQTLEPHEYRFINRWRLTGDVESVSAIIGDPQGYQRWWPSAWLDYKEIEHGDERGVGGVFRYKVKGWMPYTLNLTFHVKDVRTPNGYTVEATGDLIGQGIWTITQEGPRVEVTYEWRVRAERAFIRNLSGLLKPLFRSNHFWVMRNGSRSLTLELARRRATSPEELARVPAAPGPTFPHNLRRRRPPRLTSSDKDRISGMKITKYSHACVRLEDAGRVLVIDPGEWSEPEALVGAEAVLVTHEHSDHIDAARLAEARIPVYAPSGANISAIDVTWVSSGERFEAAGFEIQAVGSRHAFIYGGEPDCPNLGYVVDDQIYHPGDALFVPEQPIETLFVPAQGSWLKLAEAIDFVRSIKPSRTFPIHETGLSAYGLASVSAWYGRVTNHGYRYLAPGDTA